MKYCENCGAKLEDDDLFCGECGAKVEKKTMEQPTQSLNKPNRKRNKLVPILCTIIGILVVVIVIILLYGTNKIKKNRDTDTQAKLSSDITQQTELHNDITVPATEKQTEAKFDVKTLDNKSWNSKFITKNGYTYCVSIRIKSAQGNTAISELIIKCDKENSDSGFKDKLVNIPIKVTDNKLEFDVSKAEHYYTESGDLGETKEFKPLDSLKDNYKGVFQITFTSGNDNLTVVSGNIYCGKTYMNFSGTSLESSVH